VDVPIVRVGLSHCSRRSLDQFAQEPDKLLDAQRLVTERHFPLPQDDASRPLFFPTSAWEAKGRGV
jgi:hypothetical protein